MKQNDKSMVQKRAFLVCTATTAISLVGLTVFFWSCARKTDRHDTPYPRGIVLITIDALRADHVGFCGYHRNTTPFLDEIAAHGIVFQNAYAASSWTASSMASLMTGLHEREHGVRHGYCVSKDNIVVEQEILAGDYLTLAEALKSMGYETFGFSSNGHMTRDTGFAQGFTHFESCFFLDSPVPNMEVDRWRDMIANSPRFFLWIHYMDPHTNYTAREPWIDTFAENHKLADLWSNCTEEELQANADNIKTNAALRQTLIDLYDSEITFVDNEIRQLFETLNIAAESIVVITADHGEEFMDHDGLFHGKTLFEEVVRVPLVIRLPDNRNKRIVETPVSNREIPATLLALAGGHLSFPGRNLTEIQTREAQEAHTVFLELDRCSQWHGLRQGNWKYVVCESKPEREWLFNLAEDPHEQVNLAVSEPDRRDSLTQLLCEWRDSTPIHTARILNPALPPEEIQKLRSLGYVR